MRRYALPLLLAASLLAPAASAQNGLSYLTKKVDDAVKNFDAADRNHDGLLSKDEAEHGNVPFIAKHFDAIDRQHRGSVSKDDVAAYVRKSMGVREPAAAASTGK
jgi:hypothetical protein